MSTCQSNLKPDCRVNLPRISTPGHPGGECVIVPGKVGDLGTKKYVTPNNVIYTRPGTTIREFNHRGLRLPQKRPFLGPEFYNSGCSTLYGNNRFTEGPNSATNQSHETEMMYQSMFSMQPYFQGNNVPRDCSSCGAECGGPNSVSGWMTDKDGELMWMKQAKQQQ